MPPKQVVAVFMLLGLLGRSAQAGSLYVSDASAGAIYRYATDGSRTTFASGLTGPGPLVFNSSGDLFVAESTGNTYKYAQDGSRTLFSSDYAARGLACDAQDNVYESVKIVNDVAILKYSPAGSFSVFYGGSFGTLMAWPAGMAFDKSSNLYVADSMLGRIDKITPTGDMSLFANVLSGSNWGVPFDVEFDTAGNLYCTFRINRPKAAELSKLILP